MLHFGRLYLLSPHTSGHCGALQDRIGRRAAPFVCTERRHPVAWSPADRSRERRAFAASALAFVDSDSAMAGHRSAAYGHLGTLAPVPEACSFIGRRVPPRGRRLSSEGSPRSDACCYERTSRLASSTLIRVPLGVSSTTSRPSRSRSHMFAIASSVC